jgi:SM-20-related protein
MMELTTALQDLRSRDFFVWDDFLSLTEVAEVDADYQTLYDQGAFKLAGTGRDETKTLASQSIRSDETYWLDSLQLSKPQKLFWNRLEEIKLAINETEFLGLWSLEGHYSRYPERGYYQKHLDRFHSNDERTISMVLYLNSHWEKPNGGELRLHFPGANPTFFDIEPLRGRLVCFLSSSVVHEVRATQVVRKSFAGWWKRRPNST